LTDTADLRVTVMYRLLGLNDQASAGQATPPTPHQVGHWLSMSHGHLLIEAPDPEPAARLRLEVWDGPARFDEDEWPLVDVVVVDFPSGELITEEITVGSQPAIQLPSPGRWQVRVAWRSAEFADDGSLRQPHRALMQFWPSSDQR